MTSALVPSGKTNDAIQLHASLTRNLLIYMAIDGELLACSRREHPIAYASLIFTMLLPMVLGLTTLGMLLKHLMPSPSDWSILAGACVAIALIPVLMCVGALCWLLFACRIVKRPIAKAFFVCPGYGLLSSLSEWMFLFVYGKEDVDRRA